MRVHFAEASAWTGVSRRYVQAQRQIIIVQSTHSNKKTSGVVGNQLFTKMNVLLLSLAEIAFFWQGLEMLHGKIITSVVRICESSHIPMKYIRKHAHKKSKKAHIYIHTDNTYTGSDFLNLKNEPLLLITCTFQNIIYSLSQWFRLHSTQNLTCTQILMAQLSSSRREINHISLSAPVLRHSNPLTKE